MEPTLKTQMTMLADYHDWANELLLEQIETISAEHYAMPAGLFFSSIHGTLNHLLLGDRAWYGRFSGKPEHFSSLGQELEPDRKKLVAQLRERRALWRMLIGRTAEEIMVGKLQYKTTAGVPAATPWLGTLTHVFNHATHHRGQISAVLTRFGYACPELDLIHFLRLG